MNVIPNEMSTLGKGVASVLVSELDARDITPGVNYQNLIDLVEKSHNTILNRFSGIEFSNSTGSEARASQALRGGGRNLHHWVVG